MVIDAVKKQSAENLQNSETRLQAFRILSQTNQNSYISKCLGSSTEFRDLISDSVPIRLSNDSNLNKEEKEEE